MTTTWEPILAPLCAAVLLVHPTPLSWPATILGLLPSVARTIKHGRPWRRTLFDLPLLLFAAGVLVGYVVTLDSSDSDVRLAGLAAGLIVFAWVREYATTPRRLARAAGALLGLVLVGSVVLVSVAQPFLHLERVPPLGALAALLAPLNLHQPLVADPAALQRFRLYASGVGALAATGLAVVAGSIIAATGWWQRAALGGAGLFFVALLYAADNRGSMIAAAIALGLLVVFWRPRLFLLLPLLVFGIVDAIALGLAQRGLTLQTVLERLDFWQKGFQLAAETPFTGVGLGVRSVQLVYRAVYLPLYPPFNHAHNIYVQGLLEQGILGLAGLLGLAVATVVVGARLARVSDRRARGAGLAACGAALALLTAGLTEIVALTTIGGGLLFGALGLLAAALSPQTGQGRPALTSRPTRTALTPRPTRTALTPQPPLPQAGEGETDLPPPPVPPSGAGAGRRARELEPAPLARAREWGWGRGLSASWGSAGLVVGVACVVAGLALSGLWRPVAALPFLNAGTSELYLGSFQENASRADRAWALERATTALDTATWLAPGNVVARRNLALARAEAGDRAAAGRLADEALALAPPTDRPARFGVGRAYVEAEAYPEAIRVWEQAGAGPPLLQLGRRLVRGPAWEDGIQALLAAARLDAPGRSATDPIARAALAHGETTDQAIGRLTPLLEAGGNPAYQARLQIVHLLRRGGRLDEAQDALTAAESAGQDAQLDLERGLILLQRGAPDEAEPHLQRAVAGLTEPPVPVPEGDDPRYWLAVAQAALGKHEAVVRTARTGLAELPSEQSSLRGPYLLLLGEHLLALGRPDDALAAFREGQRVAPDDPRLAEGARRAQAAGR